MEDLVFFIIKIFFVILALLVIVIVGVVVIKKAWQEDESYDFYEKEKIAMHNCHHQKNKNID